MPRKLRLEYPGAIYHVMSRGDQRDDIFFDSADRYDFLKTLAEVCQKAVKEIAARLSLGKPKGARTNLHKFLNPAPQSTGSQPQLKLS